MLRVDKVQAAGGDQCEDRRLSFGVAIAAVEEPILAQVVFDAVFPAQFGSYQAIAEVDHLQRIAETQETNNSASFTFHVH